MQVTSYNSHLGLLRSVHCRVNTEQFTRAVARPASLWHQSKKWKSAQKPLVRLPDLNEAALRRTLRVRRTEQWLLVAEISCRVIGGPYDPTSQNDAGRTPAS